MGLSTRLETLRQLMEHPANEGARLRAVSDYFRWNFGRRTLRDIPHILPLVDGARIILSHRQNYATLAYVNQLWDFADMMFLLHFLRPGDRFGDLGANVGGYTILAAKCCGAEAIAVEPVPFTYDELLANVRLNDISGLVHAERCALGAAPGTLRMTAELGGMNHIATDDFAGATVDAPVVTLDTLMEGRPLNLIKMDAEGFEYNILMGGERCFADPALHAVIVELNSSGDRYGLTDDSVDAELRRHRFSPHNYDARMRTLTPMASYNRRDFNTLYIRPSPFLNERLSTGSTFNFRGRQI